MSISYGTMGQPQESEASLLARIADYHNQHPMVSMTQLAQLFRCGRDQAKAGIRQAQQRMAAYA